MKRFGVLALVAAMLLAGAIGYAAGQRRLFAPGDTYAADDCATFAQTGKTVCGRFLQYWQQNGGLAQQGLPLSDSFQERSEVDGKTYTVQYFERAVFEAHPENAPPYDVLLSLLGREKYLAKYPNGPGSSPAPSPSQAPNPGGWPRSANGLGFRLTIYAVTDPGPVGQYDFEKPKPGNRFIAVDLGVTATGQAGISTNRLYAHLKTNTDRVYERGPSVPDPQLSLGTAQPGQTVRGWVTFEVPASEKAVSLTYDPKFGDGPATVDLR